MVQRTVEHLWPNIGKMGKTCDCNMLTSAETFDETFEQSNIWHSNVNVYISQSNVNVIIVSF